MCLLHNGFQLCKISKSKKNKQKQLKTIKKQIKTNKKQIKTNKNKQKQIKTNKNKHKPKPQKRIKFFYSFLLDEHN